MKNFLKNLIRFNVGEFAYETSNYYYEFKTIDVSIDLFLIEFNFMITYWFTAENIATREARINAKLDEMNDALERWLDQIQTPPVKKSAKKPVAKKAVKKPAAKKPTVKKTAPKKTTKKK